MRAPPDNQAISLNCSLLTKAIVLSTYITTVPGMLGWGIGAMTYVHENDLWDKGFDLDFKKVIFSHQSAYGAFSGLALTSVLVFCVLLIALSSSFSNCTQSTGQYLERGYLGMFQRLYNLKTDIFSRISEDIVIIETSSNIRSNEAHVTLADTVDTESVVGPALV